MRWSATAKNDNEYDSHEDAGNQKIQKTNYAWHLFLRYFIVHALFPVNKTFIARVGLFRGCFGQICLCSLLQLLFFFFVHIAYFLARYLRISIATATMITRPCTM